MPRALLIIDVQRVLCEGRYACFEVARVIDRINLVSREARAAGVPVVLIQHETTGGGSMDRGSAGWELAPGLETAPGDHRVGKRATDSFHQTELQPLLQRLGVDELVICGLQSDFCVDTSTRRALALGYPVVLVSDGHSTLDNGVLSAALISAHHTVTLANIESFGPRLVPQTAHEIRFTA